MFCYYGAKIHLFSNIAKSFHGKVSFRFHGFRFCGCRKVAKDGLFLPKEKRKSCQDISPKGNVPDSNVHEIIKDRQ